MCGVAGVAGVAGDGDASAGNGAGDVTDGEAAEAMEPGDATLLSVAGPPALLPSFSRSQCLATSQNGHHCSLMAFFIEEQLCL